jgi:acyl carrier protein
VQDISPEATTIPIGKAIANTQIYLLDRDFNPVPIGVVGEIYLGGDGLAQGYLNRPELTTERFIPNPVVDSRRGNPPVVALHVDRVGTEAPPLSTHHSIIQQPEALPVPPPPYPSRLYKTGDLARYRSDGNLEFLGRIDQQVKIRGFRIELGEIEAVLSQHPAVREIVVVIREVEGDRQLIAYVVPDLHQVLTISELRDFLKAKLPPYMVPAAFVILETLPLTPNGKVDRRALPPPNFIQAELALKYTPPRTSIEEELMTIWSKLLGRERVGMDDNFFELGGHSLLATQLISQVRDRFQVEVPLRSLFATPTIAELAQCIEAANEAQPEFQSVGFEARSQLREEAEF